MDGAIHKSCFVELLSKFQQLSELYQWFQIFPFHLTSYLITHYCMVEDISLIIVGSIILLIQWIFCFWHKPLRVWDINNMNLTGFFFSWLYLETLDIIGILHKELRRGNSGFHKGHATRSREWRKRMFWSINSREGV